MGYTSHQRASFALLVLCSTLTVWGLVSVNAADVWLVLYAALLPVAFRLLLLAGSHAEPVRLWRAAQVWAAMRRGEIVLHYQPKVAIATREPAGVEALARWQHPRRGLLAPDRWIRATEHPWIEWRFCVYVLRAAVRQAARWRAEGHDFVVCVNVSPCSFVNPALPRLIGQTLRDHGLPGTYLCVELTEEALDLSNRSLAVANELTDLGVLLSLDDFGVGHSSMDRLVALPLTELKIDRRFVSRMVASDRNGAVVRAAVELAQSLGMVVVAEGVESAETMRSLEQLGCDVAQGFLFSPAVPQAELEEWLRADRGLRFTTAAAVQR
ncbi:MAG: bifunctional diguanylate cyclase/phosphodiesterase [Solirubrobacterales bacterium]|nr:bifunctional diguanylate cyclase/phosphodiesterase [Solirubrobacterales bacterium]